jgi:hypothetical protein
MLSQQDEDGRLRFRRRVGHAFGTDTLLGAQDDTVETALFVAACALTEKGVLLRQLAKRAKAGGERLVSGAAARKPLPPGRDLD